MTRLAQIYINLNKGVRISEEDALQLLKRAELLTLGKFAQKYMSRYHPPNRATFLIDRNINYTNICINKCRFCAFYREAENPEAYLLTCWEILSKVGEAVSMGATQIMLQGGLHPDLSLQFFEDVLQKIKASFPVTIHSFSPPEIYHLAKISNLPVKDTLIRLKRAGLDSLPGGGAEILSDRVRKIVSPHKLSTEQWLYVMETAHAAGIKTTATMMMGSIETLEERIQHMKKIRNLQDKTGGFRAFIPWSYKSKNTELGGGEISSLEYLRTLAVARIYLDNIENIQGSWVTQGPDIGQMSLFFGANDLGSTMLEENVVRATGASYRLSESEMVSLIRRAGKIPARRNTAYEILKLY